MQVYFAVALLACVLQAVVLTAEPQHDDISAPEEVAFQKMLDEVDSAEDVAVDRARPEAYCRRACGHVFPFVYVGCLRQCMSG